MKKQIKHGPEFANDDFNNKLVSIILWFIAGVIIGMLAFVFLIKQTLFFNY